MVYLHMFPMPSAHEFAVPAIMLHCRYQEIAEHAFNVIQKRAAREGGQKQKLRHAPQPLNVFIAQEVYRVLLFTVFLAQVVVARHVPYVGKLFCFGADVPCVLSIVCNSTPRSCRLCSCSGHTTAP